MVKKKPTKPWNEMTFRELTRDALIEHAVSLGDTDPEKSLEAIAYLETLFETEPLTPEMKAEKRRELKSKTKKKRDKESEQLIDTDKPLYTEKQIDKMIDKMQGTPKHSIFEIKQKYCELYYPDILPDSKDEELTIQQKLEAAKAKVKAKMKN